MSRSAGEGHIRPASTAVDAVPVSTEGDDAEIHSIRLKDQPVPSG
jgi:hypothetical protein